MQAHDLDPTMVRRLRRAEYDRLVVAGAFGDERLELIDGVIVRRSPRGTRHATIVRRLNKAFTLAVGDRAEVQIQLPLALDDTSEPEPDLSIVPVGQYLDAHPTTAWLVVEVSESSARYDLRVKAALYARAAIPELWVIDLGARVVHVHREPRPDGTWATVTRVGPGEALVPTAIDRVAIDSADLLPPPAEIQPRQS
ncbi:MAG: Uma2 family endonuclease [Myxococcota bacterium]